jgi:hypothetical protein
VLGVDSHVLRLTCSVARRGERKESPGQNADSALPALADPLAGLTKRDELPSRGYGLARGTACTATSVFEEVS